MRVTVLGAGGGLGRNVVDAALRAGHAVRAVVRNPGKVALPAGVDVAQGDARSVEDLRRAMEGSDATMFCVNPPLSTWISDFPPLLAASIEAARATGSRLVFPANVWIFGRGVGGQLVDEKRTAAPISLRGRMRAQMESDIRSAGIRWCMVRLPEFYGPHVVTLTGRVFAAALKGARALWLGPVDEPIELVYMPDGATAMIEAGCAKDTDGHIFHLPAVTTTARAFITAVYRAAAQSPKWLRLPTPMLRLAGLFDGTAAGAADMAHLWTHPILLDGGRYRERFGQIPQTPYDVGIAATLKWHRDSGAVRLQG